MSTDEHRSKDFIRSMIEADLESGKHRAVHTRFPPEPNAYLHIGHAKSICLNFGIAEEYGGRCNLRFDDTNPTREEVEYVDAIKEDVRWLGFDWEDRCYYASDYFERLYDFALELVCSGKAYVDSLSADEIREHRGTLTEPGRNSPHRDRSIDENLDLFTRMRAGEFPDGAHVLRAKIDMASTNLLMRDPTLYRIRRAHHHRTGDAWCIYPMYDFTHCLSDSIEHITHSLCSLEFENNRPLYDWVLANVSAPFPSRQTEFARLNISHTVLSKRFLIELVDSGLVSGYDDPRLHTLRGLRRRGYTPASIRAFCDKIGVAKTGNRVEMALLDFCIREDLNKVAPRVMGVLRPLRVVLTNYPEDEEEVFEFVNNPEDPEAGTRKVSFGRELFIERDDFMEEPVRKFFRLAPGREVRLRYAYFITCNEVVKDESGEIVELRCTYDPETRGGSSPDGRKVKGTLHWASGKHAVPAEVRLYENLFTEENPLAVPEGKDWKDFLNPNSLEVLSGALVEPCVRDAAPGTHYQFERMGYFCVDPDSTPERPVVNRTVTLRDSWAKISKA